MKKKILLGAISLFCLTFLMGNVSAQTTKLGIPFIPGVDTSDSTGWKSSAITVTSQAPSVIPSDGTKVNLALTEDFDFSRIKFSTTDGGTMWGDGTLKKFVMASGMNASALLANKTAPNDVFGENWFTGYCLDGEHNWPVLALYNNLTFLSSARTALLGSTAEEKAAGLKTAVDEFVKVGYIYSNLYTHNEAYPFINSVDYTIMNDKTAQDILTSLTSDNASEKTKTYTVKINSVTLASKDLSDTKEVTYDDKTITLSPTNLIFDKYISSSKVESKYDNALWVIEHSYPTLSLEESLAKADVNIETLKSQITELQKLPSNDATYQYYVSKGIVANSQKATLTEAELNGLVESYVYGVVQYAIWKAAGTKDKLGDSIVNENGAASELNKLYQYLINSGDHTGYGKLESISENVSVSGDPDKYTKSDNGYTYGPFKASYKALENTAKINLSLKTEEDGVSIVDADGNELASIKSGEEFYVFVNKKAKVGNITINLKTDDLKTFSPKTNRARIYNPVYGPYQNAITGGKLQDIKLSSSLDIVVNAKTGVEDVAILLMITLVAFSLGYLVLSYKNKPVELS